MTSDSGVDGSLPISFFASMMAATNLERSPAGEVGGGGIGLLTASDMLEARVARVQGSRPQHTREWRLRFLS